MVTFLFLFFLVGVGVNSYSLKQVLILSRHNIRTPLTYNLENVTPRKWPEWEEDIAHLTAKGHEMEEYMGNYFGKWMKKVGILGEKCPKPDKVIVYANSPQRTVETAKAFTKAAFKDCNVTVRYKNGLYFDPLFHPVIHNASQAHKNIIYKDMQSKIDKLDLNNAYMELNRILKLNESIICNTEGFCDLTAEKEEIFYEVGEEPNVEGPLKIGNSVVDSFLMEYYTGKPFSSIAWGEIDEDQLKLLTSVTIANLDVKFNITSIAKDVAKPLVKYMTEIFLNNKPKFTLLVGHDSNLNSVMAYLGVKGYELENSYEKIPIGGKLVFQKWHNEENDRDLLKVDYVYPTKDQLRKGTKLSLEEPPNWTVLEMEHCKIDENGYCLWENFENLLKSI